MVDYIFYYRTRRIKGLGGHYICIFMHEVCYSCAVGEVSCTVIILLLFTAVKVAGSDDDPVPMVVDTCCCLGVVGVSNSCRGYNNDSCQEKVSPFQSSSCDSIMLFIINNECLNYNLL